MTKGEIALVVAQAITFFAIACAVVIIIPF
jgi:hypothetical protein